jgi:hypothetical protein
MAELTETKLQQNWKYPQAEDLATPLSRFSSWQPALLSHLDSLSVSVEYKTPSMAFICLSCRLPGSSSSSKDALLARP